MSLRFFQFFPIFLFALLFISPSSPLNAQELYDGKVEGDMYVNERLGWKMKIPGGFRVETKQEVAATEGKGKEALEESTGQEIVPDHTPLLYISKDLQNQFSSASSPYDPKKDGDYDQLSEEMFNVLIQTLQQRGLNVKHTRGKSKLGGRDFNTLQLTVLTPDGTKELFHQKLFDGLIKKDVGVTFGITYNNEKDKTALLQALKKSTFPPH